MPRIPVQIIGVDPRMTGVGKQSKKPYDFYPIYWTFENDRTNGVRCSDAVLSASVAGDYVPQPGDIVDAFVQFNGFTKKYEIQAVFGYAD